MDDIYRREREDAAMDKVAASMELKLHGIPRDRQARQRLEAALGSVLPAKANGDYDPLRYGK